MDPLFARALSCVLRRAIIGKDETVRGLAMPAKKANAES
jgi:hypothetical protein